MFGRVLKTSIRFLFYDIFYAVVVSKKYNLHKSNDEYCRCDVIGSRDINQKPSINGNEFSVEIPNKYEPHQGNNVPKALFFDRETKKILFFQKKNKALGTALLTKVNILKVYYDTSKTITTHPNYG